MAEAGVWDMFLPCHYPREEEVWTPGMEHQGVLVWEVYCEPTVPIEMSMMAVCLLWFAVV